MSLKEYHRKRDFKKTAEPRGAKGVPKGWLYVVQKHDASHLHYDFRLQLGDVLLSWAVPKGPCLDPSQKRLAVHVEDHPVDYGDFEGTIPQGQYGGGTVMLWDRGHWEPVDDAKKSYAAGRLKFHLFGEKLRGGWMLVRRGGGNSPDEKNWFLFKERDDEARPLDEYDVLVEQPLSVSTGRDLDEIANGKSRVWQSNGKPKRSSAAQEPAKKQTVAKSTAKKKAASKRAKRPRAKRSRVKPDDVPGAQPGRLPKFVKPQLATLTDEAPAGDEWIHEIKFDGYRMLCRIDRGRSGEPAIEFITRNEQNWTAKLPALVEAAAALPVETALVDGEVVALEPDGLSSFQSLQNAFREGRPSALVYYVFDLLHLNGTNLMPATLDDRKRVLSDLVPSTDSGPIRFSDHVPGSGAEFFQQACKAHLEGIICKRRDRPYSPGRGYDWLKVKCVRREEFVIGGYTPPGGSRTGFGALLLGYHDRGGKLSYAGKVGTGFDERTLTDLHAKLRRIETKTSPFGNLRGSTGEARHANWVEPRLVAQIAFSQWTDDGRLRHPAFLGLREDKPARDVVHDVAVKVKQAVKASERDAPRVHSTAHTKRRASNDEPADTVLGVTLSHPEKVLYPEQGITKVELAQYYKQVTEWMLPQVAGRPIVLVRCPEGRRKTCFYQKHPGVGTPKEFRQVSIREAEGPRPYLVIEEAADLVRLVQMGVLEIHIWGSRADDVERPDRLIFDLDPAPDVPWPRVTKAAGQVRDFLEELGLESFLKTTGGKGLHLVVPIQRRTDWDEAKAFCKRVAEAIVRADPDHFTSNMSKAARTGKIYIDYLRNGRGATAVAAYSSRARDGATVSTPLDWKELTANLKPAEFTVRTVPARLAKLRRDPWAGIDKVRQSLTTAMRKRLDR
ncbi:MAG TPA: DNA ligase D [Pirellulales bacterium]|jgi:bifunctional non-homologous end joining protein LigD|nr:DNA ligase D [Pirellulales bacterium]